MNPLKIEVTEAMGEAVLSKFLEWHGDKEVWPPEVNREYRIGAMRIALTAAFQHPEFLRQIREQVVGCVPERESYTFHCDRNLGRNESIDITRASLGRLLGEVGK
jgi:hypothetical protein